MSKYIGFDVDSNKTVACVVQKDKKDRYSKSVERQMQRLHPLIPRLQCKDCGAIYGYRDEEYLKLRIFNLHNSTYALTG